jgi:hypothetical protein
MNLCPWFVTDEQGIITLALIFHLQVEFANQNLWYNKRI